ncbi:MAG: SAM-dependent methyltransferase [Gammaproteobacteria bacterium]|nr:SAM-dependent methyltransferase [Gammaproteobacteria bacterium]
MASTAAISITGPDIDEVFSCPEESTFYAQCLRSLIFGRQMAPQTVTEFGAGDGAPVIEAVRISGFKGTVHGFELSVAACHVANRNVKLSGLHGRYVIENQSFFDSTPPADCLIANPPYLPAPDANIRMPLLYAGDDGCLVTNALLSMNYDRVLVMISSYSNPVGSLRHAAVHGYAVSDFMLAPLTFGIYSSEAKVRQHIGMLKETYRAFYTEDMYLLAGVLFDRHASTDRSAALRKLITAL